MLANAITLTRLLLTFVVITMLGGYLTLDIALIAMIALKPDHCDSDRRLLFPPGTSDIQRYL